MAATYELFYRLLEKSDKNLLRDGLNIQKKGQFAKKNRSQDMFE
jgi:hypothetical protein